MATGLKWFQFLCNEKSQYNSKIETEFVKNGEEDCEYATCIETFHSIVRKFHTGVMKKDTLNIGARAQAGMTGEWFDSLYTN